MPIKWLPVLIRNASDRRLVDKVTIESPCR